VKRWRQHRANTTCRPRENDPEGRSFEDRSSVDPVTFVKKTLDSRFRRE
jgi:hypothetical protein